MLSRILLASMCVITAEAMSLSGGGLFGSYPTLRHIPSAEIYRMQDHECDPVT